MVLHGFVSVFPPKTGDKTRPRTGFHFNVLMRTVPDLVVHLWLRGLIWRVGLRLIQVARCLLVVVFLPVLLMLRRRGTMGISTPDVSQCTASSSSSSLVLWVGTLSHSLDQWRSITSNRLTIFSLCRILPCSIISGGSMLRQLQLIIPLFTRKWICCLLRK